MLRQSPPRAIRRSSLRHGSFPPPLGFNPSGGVFYNNGRPAQLFACRSALLLLSLRTDARAAVRGALHYSGAA
jgi:hypothetical protein